MKFLDNPDLMGRVRQIIQTYRGELDQAVASRTYRVVEDLIMLDGMAENPDWKIKKKPGWGPKFWKRWILNG